MDTYETLAKYNIAETCCDSISIDQLQSLSDIKDASILPTSKRLDYGEIRGSSELRQALANLYSSKVSTPLPLENILITPGAISANTLLFYALVQPGDHIICHYPTYQQLYAVPASLGAEVSLWHARPEKQWIPSLDELKTLIKPNTKLIIINIPNNPTGAILPKSLLQDLVGMASEHSITILSDEVYRPIFHSITPLSPDFPPSILSLGYSHTIATGSLSKAYSLAGIRIGWIASRSREIIERVAAVRHYTTISVSQLDSAVAAFALSPHTVHALIGRNIGLAKRNLDLLERFVIKHDDICTWMKPLAGTTAFVQFHRERHPVDDIVLCKRLVEETGVLWVPGGHCFGNGRDFAGYVRIGFVCAEDALKEGLEKVGTWLRKEFDDLPLAKRENGGRDVMSVST
jgi:aspartate/methionine/tyrosine aminotransferase